MESLNNRIDEAEESTYNLGHRYVEIAQLDKKKKNVYIQIQKAQTTPKRYGHVRSSPQHGIVKLKSKTENILKFVGEKIFKYTFERVADFF